MMQPTTVDEEGVVLSSDSMVQNNKIDIYYTNRTFLKLTFIIIMPDFYFNNRHCDFYKIIMKAENSSLLWLLLLWPIL